MSKEALHSPRCAAFESTTAMGQGYSELQVVMDDVMRRPHKRFEYSTHKDHQIAATCLQVGIMVLTASLTEFRRSKLSNIFMASSTSPITTYDW